MLVEVVNQVKALADAQNIVPGLSFRNHDNSLIAMDIEDDPEDEYTPEADHDDEDLAYNDDIAQDEIDELGTMIQMRKVMMRNTSMSRKKI